MNSEYIAEYRIQPRLLSAAVQTNEKMLNQEQNLTNLSYVA